MIQKLVSIYQIKERYDKHADTYDPVATRREPQCPYQLLKILFSDKCAKVKVANKQLFWEGVQEPF